MTSDGRFCSHCGKPALAGAAFCAYCGEPFPVSAQPDEALVRNERAVSLPDYRSAAGACHVIHTGECDMNIPRVGRVVAKATKLPLGDVTRRMRTTKGFVASGVGGETAAELVHDLAGLGVRAFVLPEADCIPLPEIMRMRHVEITRDGLACEAYTWNQTERVELPWEEVFLVSIGRLALERVSEREVQAESSNPFERMVPNLVTNSYKEFMTDIVLFAPWRRLRLDYNTASYAFTDNEADPEHALKEMKSCARGLAVHGHELPMNAGVALLGGRSEEWEWERLTFLGKADFDSYTHWLVQLVRYGYAVPV